MCVCVRMFWLLYSLIWWQQKCRGSLSHVAHANHHIDTRLHIQTNTHINALALFCGWFSVGKSRWEIFRFSLDHARSLTISCTPVAADVYLFRLSAIYYSQVTTTLCLWVICVDELVSRGTVINCGQRRICVNVGRCVLRRTAWSVCVSTACGMFGLCRLQKPRSTQLRGIEGVGEIVFFWFCLV